MSIIEQIKAEIDKRYAEYLEKMKTYDFTYYEGMADALDLFDQFIDTLESEKSVPADVEEAAKKYVSTLCDRVDEGLKIDTTLESAFKAGAEWDREQMMKEAIPCKVFLHDGCPLLDYTQEQQDNALERIGANVGDKVRIIIVKED